MHPKPTLEQELARQKALEQAGRDASEFVAANPGVVLEAASDVVSLVTLGPEAAPAKRMMVSAIKSGFKWGLEKSAAEPLVTKIDGSKIIADITIGKVHYPQLSKVL